MVEIEIEEAARLRRAAYRLVRHLTATASNGGLTPGDASVLASIVYAGPISAAEIIATEHINNSVLSRAVGRLAQAGLVERRQNPDDLREALFEPTPDGRAVHERIVTERAALIISAIETLEPGDQTTLRAALPVLEALADAIPAENRSRTPSGLV